MLDSPAKTVGKTGIAVPPLALGGTGIGNAFRSISDDDATETVHAALDGGIRLLDVAPVYGFGTAERRVGAALSGVARERFMISTKVGYRMIPLEPGDQPNPYWIDAPPVKTCFDFSYDFAMRSLGESLERLKLDRVEFVAIHDPDEAVGFQPPSGRDPKDVYREVFDGTYRALNSLREQGVIDGIGIGINHADLLMDYVRDGDFDFFMLAGRYTLLDHEILHTLLPLCVERKTSIMAGGPLNSGILSTGAVEGAQYHYMPAPPEIMDRVRRIEAICADFGISLRAAALQFPVRHQAVAASVPGARTVAHVNANVAAMSETIAEGFWDALRAERLIDPACP
ncbi:MAG: hypothetical protein RIS17_806 [Pseudomonadota bacterium]